MVVSFAFLNEFLELWSAINVLIVDIQGQDDIEHFFPESKRTFIPIFHPPDPRVQILKPAIFQELLTDIDLKITQSVHS